VNLIWKRRPRRRRNMKIKWSEENHENIFESAIWRENKSAAAVARPQSEMKLGEEKLWHVAAGGMQRSGYNESNRRMWNGQPENQLEAEEEERSVPAMAGRYLSVIRRKLKAWKWKRKLKKKAVNRSYSVYSRKRDILRRYSAEENEAQKRNLSTRNISTKTRSINSEKNRGQQRMFAGESPATALQYQPAWRTQRLRQRWLALATFVSRSLLLLRKLRRPRRVWRLQPYGFSYNASAGESCSYGRELAESLRKLATRIPMVEDAGAAEEEAYAKCENAAGEMENGCRINNEMANGGLRKAMCEEAIIRSVWLAMKRKHSSFYCG